MPSLLLLAVASPEGLPIHPQCYLRLRQEHKFVKFYPSKRHHIPILVMVGSHMDSSV
jgi:hypothetical protein